jgi:hypothetical protein
MTVAVERLGRHLGRGDFDQRSVACRAEKAVPAAGVAGDAVLVHQQQQGVAVTIDSQFLQVLDLAGSLAFAPQPGSAAAEVADAAGREGFIQAIIRTSPVSCCWAMAGTRPLASKRTACSTASAGIAAEAGAG